MKQILATLALIALALSFASCDKTCNCNCSCCSTNGSDQTIQRPGGSGSGNNGGTADDSGNGGNNGNDNTGGGNGNTGGVDRSDYEVYNHTMTQGYAGYYGVYYDDQPSGTVNWYVELADDDYNLEDYTGDGYNIALEMFTSGSSYTASLPTGTYNVVEEENDLFNDYSLLFGFTQEVEDEGGQTQEYPFGTWLYEGSNPLAGATSGTVTISKSGSSYTINYTLYDDEYQIAFKGNFSGALEFYDGTQNASYVASKSFAPRKNAQPVRHYRIRK